ncbi:MAG: hybrid sensor histidine kinase/response regulator [Confluentimicrobium sp.]|uniref:hybrid sensor histidine kinase/response regulator n=1 Tax=Actibacterium sp. TaxID=1872125 RepID=UPI000C6C0884|nr:ATP-binding protein [Actibacterium sp.]MBC57766.1 hybrid sensor histidine kinase/response regulator [Actibacterium sp.]
MPIAFSATLERRRYNRWVANETMEDFALRFTARRARRWSALRVANTAIGSISFLALEAIGGAITLTYGFDTAILAIMLVGLLLFLTGLPISFYAARYGVDIDLLTRGAGFGYIGSTITSLIYASFTFIFFALEAAILSLALEFCFGIPLFIGYLLSALIVIPLVVNGFSKISAFQAWTQPLWVVLHILPFAMLGIVGYDFDTWTGFAGTTGQGKQGATLVMLGAAAGGVFSLIAQIGEQVDFLRFLPEPKTRAERRKWWAALIAAGPGWSVLGVLKMLAGSYLVTLALRESVPASEAGDPTRMYFTAFDQVLSSPMLVMALTGTFVILSQLKINVTNAYAGSIAWSNFFSRLTHSHPGRVVWLVFNVAIALMLMELGVFHAIESTLTLYSHVALAWIGALVSDLVVNKPLGLSPRGIEFRRAHLYDINPVGIGAMACAGILSFLAHFGLAGETAQSLSSFIALLTAFGLAPLIAWYTDGRYYIARAPQEPAAALQECCVCEYRFDPEDMTNCPFYAGPICSLCCTLDSSCRDACKPNARIGAMAVGFIRNRFPARVADVLMSRFSVFVISTTVIAGAFGGLLLLIRSHAGKAEFDAVLAAIFCTVLVVIGVSVWMFILATESQHKARDETELQTQRLLREVRAHERTDQALQEAKEKAEAANLAKTRYMTGISHELRTPLNAIYGFAQILEKDPEIPPHRRESVSTIRRSSEHLAGLIEGLLDISKIEAGRLELYRDRINLRMFLTQVASIFSEAAKEKNLNFRMETRGSLPEWVGFDEKRLRQIIINLLSNALRYTDKGEVCLSVRYRNEVALIEVSDTGIGIPPHELDRIWKPFERGGQVTAQGSGLGLTITKLLVEILGGEISVESTPFQGSTFRVRLMLPSIPHSSRYLRERADEPASLNVRGYSGARKTIMVVDDDLNHLSLVEHWLQPLGFLVLVASNTEIALEMLGDISPDIFILDIDMPGRDGWDLATHLRSHDHRATPIIMISGHALEGRKPGPETALYDAFIAKPYNLDDLFLRISTLLKLELISEDDGDEPAAARAPLPRAEIGNLIELSEIGHASAIRVRLAELEAAGTISDAALGRLRAKLSVFDMAGLTQTLRELQHDAA